MINRNEFDENIKSILLGKYGHVTFKIDWYALAKLLDISLAKTKYHIDKLDKQGFLKLIEKSKRSGGYTSPNIIQILGGMEKKIKNMIKPTIEQYLLSTCLFIIDEFNEYYGHLDKVEIKKIADSDFNEMDICVRIGYPFRQMAHYTQGDKSKGNGKINHDIYVKSKDYKIEVKYLKNWDSASGTSSGSKNWSAFLEDFQWLQDEIRNNKGARAFIIGWFNCVDRFSRLIQIGDGPGSKPLASEEKICYFPFLHKSTSPTLTTDLVYRYSHAYKSIPVNLIGDIDVDMSCLFLGNEDDVFHFALYF